MQKINIMGIRSSVILNKYRADWLIMEEITEEQEKEIDIRGDIDEIYYITKSNIKIPAKDIFLYGEIDLESHSDLELIRKADIVTQEVNNAAVIPSNFDYESGFVYTDKEGQYKVYNTWNKVNWFKYNHCLIGKPKRVIIYRINKVYVQRNRSTRRSNTVTDL